MRAYELEQLKKEIQEKIRKRLIIDEAAAQAERIVEDTINEFIENQKDEQIIRKAIRVFGVPHQLDMAIEECAELIKAINKLKRGKGTVNELAEEAEDVQVLIDQIRIMIPADYEGIRKYKIDRLEYEMKNKGSGSWVYMKLDRGPTDKEVEEMRESLKREQPKIIKE